MRRFDSKVIVITGAGSGFGAAMVERFQNEGGRIIAADINAANLEKLIDTAEGKVTSHICDVSIAVEVKAMIESVIQEFGRIDVLINNAGFSHLSGKPWELDETEYDRVFATNTKGVWLGVKYVVPHMIQAGGGVILNTASIGAVAPRPGVTVYNATKGAVMTMTMGLAVDLARYGIRVNAMNPVAADTGFMKTALGTDELHEANRNALIKGIPLRRLTEPQDVAAAAAFLASEDASFLTGVCLPIDGGRSIS